jgi:hypothetical protein
MTDTPDSQGRRPDENPEPSWAMPPMPPAQWQPPSQPGVIPLRPLGVGDILGGSIATMRTRPALMLGVTAVVVAVTQLLILAATLPLLDDMGTAVTDPYAQPEDVLWITGMALVVTLIGVVFTIASRVFLAGIVTVVVGTAVLGERPTFGEVMARVRPRLLPLLGLTLVLSVVLVAAIAVVAVVVAAVPGFGVLVALGMVVVAVWLWTLFALATPALVLEGVGVGQAFERSRQLVRGSWWRIFGITLLASVIAGAVAFVISIPFESLGGAFATDVPTTTKYLVLSTIGAVIASTVTEPFVAASTCLLYTDQRIRLENLDVELARMSTPQPPASGSDR